MANFQTHQRKARKLTPRKVSSDLFKFIKSIEDEIFDLNIKQLYKAEDSKGNPLINKNNRFSGVYKQLTVDIASSENPILSKKVGELYNFGWTGDFLKGFEMKLFSDHVDIFSTGTGSEDKKSFFDGYNSLYGLTTESIYIIIESKLKQFFINYYKKRILQ